nr:energy transducer TonB [Gammaproteobacteria bacterium]
WRAKVERVGNLNYPDEARRQKLSGSLLLDVSVNTDGTVNEIQLRRSSGHKVLDDAAIRIVRLAAPFPPFPKDIEQEVDMRWTSCTSSAPGSSSTAGRWWRVESLPGVDPAGRWGGAIRFLSGDWRLWLRAPSCACPVRRPGLATRHPCRATSGRVILPRPLRA